MARWTTQIRRAMTQAGMDWAADLSAHLSAGAALVLGRAIGTGGALAAPLRMRLAKNMELALGKGNIPPGVGQQYFQNLGQLVGWSMAIYRHGLVGSGACDKVRFDDSVCHLDDAIARGRGVIVAAPHLFGHEIAAGHTALQRGLVALVRESKNPKRTAMKHHWYAQLGVETLRRPRKASVMSDIGACVEVLSQGKVLAITPDVVVSETQGMPVRVFDREVYLQPGMVYLAVHAGAPLVSSFGQWDQESGVSISFNEPIEFEDSGPRKRIVLAGLQDWCDKFEAYVRANPANWLFWMDKRWTRVIRSGAAVTGT